MAHRKADSATWEAGRTGFSFEEMLSRHRDRIVCLWRDRLFTEVRLESGFQLDDVQRAFDLFRQIIVPILVAVSAAFEYRRVTMEKKSRQMERMAYIGQITASLSHEIRNPLSSIKMNLQILGQNNPFTGKVKRFELKGIEDDRALLAS